MTKRTAALVDRLLGELFVVREEQAQERKAWAVERARLLADFAQERTVLLNRIQDPPAGVASSLATLEGPAPGEMDMD